MTAVADSAQRTPPAACDRFVTEKAHNRGERLYPQRSSRVYWALKSVRVEMQEIIRLFLSDPSQPKKWLVDFGCGNMPYRPLFERHVGEYFGCDLQGNELADRIIERANVLPFEDRSVDAVLSSFVLEHALETDSYLAEANRVLADGGLLILATHGVWRYHPDPLDLWRWTSEGLKRVIQAAGFSVLRFRGILGPGATALQLWQDASIKRIHWRLQTLFSVAMQAAISFADRNCPPAQRDADGAMYVVVGAKTPGSQDHNVTQRKPVRS
jgi:SAM-dependent methyltransferase